MVNNAGHLKNHESIMDIHTEEYDRTMTTNFYAPFWIIKAALPHPNQDPVSLILHQYRPMIHLRIYRIIHEQRQPPQAI
ncbi:hypothetical protein ACK1KB_01120 [Chryseobacterium sp. TY3]